MAHDHGLRTAWSDKHPAYEALEGPSGNSIDDLFTPEIDSDALEPNGKPYPGEISWTEDNAATMQYDSYKVQAVLNEIDGYDHSRKTKVGVPAIFGMNFQTRLDRREAARLRWAHRRLPARHRHARAVAPAGARLHQREAASDG